MISRMTSRRAALQQSMAVAGMLVAAGVLPRTALAFNKDAFDAKTVADVMKALGAGAPAESVTPSSLPTKEIWPIGKGKSLSPK